VKQRYSSWDSGIGGKIEKGKVGLKELETYMLKKGNVAANASGRQEFLENLISLSEALGLEHRHYNVTVRRSRLPRRGESVAGWVGEKASTSCRSGRETLDS
jgi:hypothetical protein